MDEKNRKHNGPMPREDAEALALRALIWLLADESRADRLLALTGMTPDDLREGVGEAGVLAALLDYLTRYEPDLIAFAESNEVDPSHIVAAHHVLTGEHWEG